MRGREKFVGERFIGRKLRILFEEYNLKKNSRINTVRIYACGR